MSILGFAAASGISLAGYLMIQHGSATGQSRGSALAAAIPTPGGPNEPAAIVNGQAISRFELAASEAMANGVAGGLALNGNSAPAPSRRDLLNQMIDAELKYQEAQRLGLTASDDEVTAWLARSRKDLENPSNASAKEFFIAANAKLGISYADYWTDPRVREGVQKNLLVAKYNQQITPAGANSEQVAVVQQQKIAELRARADIEILVMVS